MPGTAFKLPTRCGAADGRPPPRPFCAFAGTKKQRQQTDKVKLIRKSKVVFLITLLII
jgi:hypothetical protein